jgi:hypothetical protein
MVTETIEQGSKGYLDEGKQRGEEQFNSDDLAIIFHSLVEYTGIHWEGLDVSRSMETLESCEKG